MCGKTAVLVALSLVAAGCVGRADLSVVPTLRSHTERLTELPAQFTIDVGGETEPRMVSLTLEGPISEATVACDRWIDCTSLEGMLRSIITPEMTEKEKALAIWHFVMDWAHEHDGHTCDDPLEYACVWGYSYCGPMAILTEALCDAAGVSCRYINPTSHGTTEMFWGGEWHLLDSSCRYYFLRRDNRTIASIGDLARDNELVTRTHDDVGRALKWGGGIEGHLKQYGDDSDDWVTDDFRWWKSSKWDPRVTLRSSEVLTRRWDNVGLWSKAHGKGPPRIYANGTLDYEPDLRAVWDEGAFQGAHEVVNFGFDRGAGVLRPRAVGEAAALVLRVRTPYFTPQVHVIGLFRLASSEDRARIALSVDEGKSWQLLREAAGRGQFRLWSQTDLTQEVTHETPGKYSFLVRYELVPGRTPTACALEGLAVHANLQYHPKALPALSLGTNTIGVDGRLPEGESAALTYTWLEDLNLWTDPQRPRVGLPCTVTGRVTNRGEGPAENVVVRFYDGNPSEGGGPLRGRPIAEDFVIERLASGETRKVQVTWVPEGRKSWYEDMTEVWMVVDPDGAVSETDERNNATYVDTIVSEKPNLVLLDPSFVTAEREGDVVTLTAAVRNWDLWGLNPGNAVVENVVVRFYDGDPAKSGRQIGEAVIPKIVAGEFGWATVKWNVARLSGTRRVHVIVDPDEKIPERFESPEHPCDEVVKEIKL